MKSEKSDPKIGLNAAQVKESRSRYGENILTPPKRTPLWKLYLEKYEDPIIRILLVAAAISLLMAFITDEYVETIGIILAIFFATTVGFYFERDAAKKFSVLTAMGEEQPVKVVRDGRVVEIARREVVVGDIVLIETGDEVPADGRLLQSEDLQIDESSLTGEPVAIKGIGLPGDELPYPPDCLLRSTMVMSGSGRMRVEKIGDFTEIGKVATQSAEMTSVKTPLNIQLDRLAGLISKVGTTISIAAFVLFLVHDILTGDIWHSDDYVGMATIVLKYFMMSVTLIVMAVPEGLPMAVTLALALNMRRMLKSNNLVRKLSASETMGSVNIICTDKTGTLTQNSMTVVDFMADGDRNTLFDALALNTTAYYHDGEGVGNPTEIALLRWLTEQGEDYSARRRSLAVVDRQPFSTERKYMSTTVEVGGVKMKFIKGAPEIILGHCAIGEEQKAAVELKLNEWQSKAMRTLALACKDESTEEYTFQAVFAINDPVREDVPQAVANCRKAGIRVIIVTGDTMTTAAEIGRQIGIIDDGDNLDEVTISGADFESLTDEEAKRRIMRLKVMSRARPSDKRRLVVLLQQLDNVVAVTGDGTNDAPALNHAHVGLSLGSGTAVAKNASDITIIDDSFRSIVKAVMWGRSLYKNIQRFIFFQLVVNVTALLLVLGGSVIGTEMPLTITQILWVNLIMDTFAAMALASLPPSYDVLNEKPRSTDAFIINSQMKWGICLLGGVFFLFTFALLYYFERIHGIDRWELTVFFSIFVMLQWWNLFNAKALGSNHSAFHNLHLSTGFLFVLLLVLVGQWLIVTFGGEMFRTMPLSAETWLYIILGTSPVMLVGEMYRMLRRVF